jgi:hypothetical protein
MAPTLLQKRRRDYIESPTRNRRCMDTRKHTISDEQIRTRCSEEADTSTSMFDSTINTMSSWVNYLATSVSEAFTGEFLNPHTQLLSYDYGPSSICSQSTTLTKTHLQVKTTPYIYQRGRY